MEYRMKPVSDLATTPVLCLQFVRTFRYSVISSLATWCVVCRDIHAIVHGTSLYRDPGPDPLDLDFTVWGLPGSDIWWPKVKTCSKFFT